MKIIKFTLWITGLFLVMNVFVVENFYQILLPGIPLVYAADSDEDKAKKTEEGDVASEKDGKKASPCPECPKCPDPAKVVLQGLEEKKQAIEEERKATEQEKKELEKYSAQVDEKLEALANLRKQIQEDMAVLDKKKTLKEIDSEKKFETKLRKLVKMYAGMKPKQAAAIVDKMDLTVAQDIFLRMRGETAAKILGFVDATKAAKISEFLAYKK